MPIDSLKADLAAGILQAGAGRIIVGQVRAVQRYTQDIEGSDLFAYDGMCSIIEYFRGTEVR